MNDTSLKYSARIPAYWLDMMKKKIPMDTECSLWLHENNVGKIRRVWDDEESEKLGSFNGSLCVTADVTYDKR